MIEFECPSLPGEKCVGVAHCKIAQVVEDADKAQQYLGFPPEKREQLRPGVAKANEALGYVCIKRARLRNHHTKPS